MGKSIVQAMELAGLGSDHLSLIRCSQMRSQNAPSQIRIINVLKINPRAITQPAISRINCSRAPARSFSSSDSSTWCG
jgi:hypothetical protein